MQRWMQAKMQLARSHGIAISGANRPMGGVMDDRPLGYVDASVKGEPRRRDVVMVLKAKRPKAWGATKAAKRAARP